MNAQCKQILLALSLLPALLPFVSTWAGGKAAVKTKFFFGQVVSSKEPAAKGKVDAVNHRLAFIGDHGKVLPLLKDAGSLMFFTDEKLLRRPMRLTGKVLDSGGLQVVQVHSLVKGKLHEPYYWCEVCAIKRFQGGICDCCGDKLEFREVAIKE